MEKQKKSINQKQSAALEQVYRACMVPSEPSFIIESVNVYVYSVRFTITAFCNALDDMGLYFYYKGECIFVHSPYY